MQFPEIGTPLSLLAVPLFLWFWTLKHAKAKLFHQEIILTRQNRRASWSYAFCLLSQITAIMHPHDELVRVSTILACYLVMLFFLLATHRHGSGFWTKRRNQVIGGSVLLAMFSIASNLIADLYVIPIMTSFAIATICQQRFVAMFTASLRDVEALQVKLLRQEATFHNQKQTALLEN